MHRLLLPALLCAPVAAQGVLLPGGTPDPGHPDLYSWFDAEDGVNGPGQPADGADVTSWVDRTGKGHDLVRVDPDPLRLASFSASGLNGQAVVEFDGNDYLWGDGATEFGTLPGEKTIFVVARADAGDGGYVFDSSSTLGRNALFAGQSSAPGLWQLYAGVAPASYGPSVKHGRWHVFTARFEANQNWLVLDGGLGVVDSLPTAVPTSDLIGLMLGSRYTVNFGLDGAIAELLVYDRALLQDERAAIEGYLFARYGLPMDLWGDLTSVAVATGGTQELGMELGSAQAGRTYFVLGTQSGTSPGLVVDGHTLPLNPDGYWVFTLQNPSGPPLTGGFGTLGALGDATATLTVPPGLGPSFSGGVTLHHAVAVLQLAPTVEVTATSQAVPLVLTP